jgi:hypothetical protein
MIEGNASRFNQLILSGFAILCLTNPLKNIHAVRKMIITSDRTSIIGEDIINLTASCSGFTNSENIRIKGAFRKDGSTNYFGISYDGNNEIKNNAASDNQRLVTIGDWDGQLHVKGDYTDTGYVGNGEYLLRLGFYYLNSKNELSSVEWSDNSIPVSITGPTPTLTPTLTPTKSPTPTKTPTPSITPYKTPNPTQSGSTSTESFYDIEVIETVQTPSVKSFSIKADTNKVVISTSSAKIASPSPEISGKILGANISATPSASGNKFRNTAIGLLIIALGMAFLALASVIKIIQNKAAEELLKN